MSLSTADVRPRFQIDMDCGIETAECMGDPPEARWKLA